MGTIQTKQQKRAKFALENLPMEGSKVNHELAQFIIGMPTMILSNGIGQTLAFILSKKSKKDNEKRYAQTFDILKKWLEKTMSEQFPDTADDKKFLECFNEISQSEYLAAQEECLRLVEWLKRYARAFDEGKKSDGAKQEMEEK